MYNYKARIYSPTLGRFMQTDPIGYGDGVNWYNYVGSDPVNSKDTTGKFDEVVERRLEYVNWRRSSDNDNLSGVIKFEIPNGDFSVSAPPSSPCLGFSGPCGEGPGNQKSPSRWFWDQFQEALRSWNPFASCDTSKIKVTTTAVSAAKGAARGVLTGGIRRGVQGAAVGGPAGAEAGAVEGAVQGGLQGAVTGGASSAVQQACSG